MSILANDLVKKSSAVKAAKKVISTAKAAKVSKKANVQITDNEKVIALNVLAEQIKVEQQDRHNNAIKVLDSKDNFSDQALATASDDMKNSFARIKRLNKLLSSNEKQKLMLLRHFVNVSDIVAPDDMYAWDTALKYIYGAEFGTPFTTIPEKNAPKHFFLPFTRSLTVSKEEHKDNQKHPKCSTKSSGTRWTTAPAWALEKMGAMTIDKSAKQYTTVLNPKHKLIKKLLERNLIPALADS